MLTVVILSVVILNVVVPFLYLIPVHFKSAKLKIILNNFLLVTNRMTQQLQRVLLILSQPNLLGMTRQRPAFLFLACQLNHTFSTSYPSTLMPTYVDVLVRLFIKLPFQQMTKRAVYKLWFSCQYNQTFLTSSPSTMMPTYVEEHVDATSFCQHAIL